VFCIFKLSNLLQHDQSNTIRYDTIGEFNVDWKAEYSALCTADNVVFAALLQPMRTDGCFWTVGNWQIF